MSGTAYPSGNIFSLDSGKFSAEDIQRIAEVILGGGVIIYPTDTIYGIGCDALNEKAVERVYQLKQRPEQKPMLLLVNGVEMTESLVGEITPSAMQLMQECWPGPLTLLFRPKEGVCSWLSAGSGKIGVRFPRHAFCNELVSVSGKPLLSTSANISGKEYTGDIIQLQNEFGAGADMIIDAGHLPDSPSSTVLDITGQIPELIREGAYPKAELVKHIGTLA